MDQNELGKIKKTAQDFFEKMGFEIKVEVSSPEDLTIPVNLTMEEPQILIGERGQTLAEMQYLLKAILRKQISTQEAFYINLDINDYKKKKMEYLKEMAENTADEVALTKKEKLLPAMPAYERRIIHLALASRDNVITESIGQGTERKIVIRSHP